MMCYAVHHPEVVHLMMHYSWDRDYYYFDDASKISMVCMAPSTCLLLPRFVALGLRVIDSIFGCIIWRRMASMTWLVAMDSNEVSIANC